MLIYTNDCTGAPDYHERRILIQPQARGSLTRRHGRLAEYCLGGRLALISHVISLYGPS